MNTRIIPALLGALLFSGVAEAAPSIYPAVSYTHLTLPTIA